MKKRLAALIDRHSKLILFVIFAMTLAMIPGLKRIQIVSQPASNSFANPNEYVRSVQEVKKSFGANERLVLIAIEAQDSHTLAEPPALQLISKMTAALKTVPMVRRDTILSLASVGDVVNNEEGLSSVPLLQKIPTNYFEQEELRAKISKNEFIFGRLISKDFRTTMIVAAAYEEGSLYTLHDQLDAALKPYVTGADKHVPFRVTLAGDSEVNYQLETNIQKDAALFLFIAILLIIASFYFMFKTWKGVVLLIAAMVVGISWTMGLIGYYGEPISILSAMLPVVIVVIGSSYAIHVFHNLSDEYQKSGNFREAFEKVLNKILSPLFMSSVTTFVGGISLLSFKLKMIQHFGASLAMGTLITFLTSLFVIPSIYRALRGRIQKIEDELGKKVVAGVNSARHLATSTIQLIPVAGPVTGVLAGAVQESITGGVKGFVRGAKKGRLMERFLKTSARLVSRHPWFVVALSLLIVAVSITQMRKVQIGFDNISLLPNGYPIKSVMERLDKTFNGIQGFDMLLDTGKQNGALDPAFLRKVDEFGKRARELPEITHVFSIVDVLKKADTVLNVEAPPGSDHIPASPEAASQYLFLLGSSGGGLSVSGIVTSDYRKIRVDLTTSARDTQRVEAIYVALKDISAEVFGESIKADLGGSLVGYVGILHYVVWGKIQNVMISLLLILLVVATVYRSVTRGFLSILTLPVGVICNFGLMGYAGIRLDMVTAIITSFAMGIGVDFSIHFISAVKEEYEKTKDIETALERAVSGPGVAIAYNAISTKIGFSALLFSHFSSIHTFATLMCFNMMILAVGALTLLPAVIRILPPEFIVGHPRLHKPFERRFKFAMKVAFSSVVVAVLCAGIIIVDAKAAETMLTPEALLKKSVQAVHTQHEESAYVMKLVGAGGDVSVRKMKVWFKSKNEEDAKLLIKFTEPADIRGTGFLTIAEKGKTPDQWLYLPALKKSRRIKGGNADEPFLGSDFSMGDLSVDKNDGLRYKVDGVQKCEGGECYVVTGTPKSDADKGNLTYSKKTFFIRKDNFLGVKGEFYNQAGQLEKVMTMQKIHKEGNRWVGDVIEMKNLLTKHSTVLEFEKRDTASVPADTVFTPAFLERQ